MNKNRKVSIKGSKTKKRDSQRRLSYVADDEVTETMSIGDETHAGINEVQSYLSGGLSGRNAPAQSFITATRKPVVSTINKAIMKGKLTKGIAKTRTYENSKSKELGAQETDVVLSATNEEVFIKVPATLPQIKL